MKKEFEMPSCTVVTFSVEDIITASGWMTDLVGFGGEDTVDIPAMDA